MYVYVCEAYIVISFPLETYLLYARTSSPKPNYVYHM
jgi:hypothetical protein